MDAKAFHDTLEIIPSFRLVSDYSRYTPLPDDWYLALADIRNSTDAIRLGRYKEVSMAGACIIAALNNFYKRDHFLPYLFGGDGSILALPDYQIDKVRGILAFCRNAVKNAYGLEMTAGIVSVRELRNQGQDIRVARLRMSEFIDQTIFWGSGLAYAEQLIKDNKQLDETQPIPADFSGLECRWSQMPSSKDEVATYIIQAMGSSEEERVTIYERCFEEIETIYGPEEDFHPIREEALRMTANPKLLGVEWKLRTQPPTWKKRIIYGGKLVFQLLAGTYLMKFKKRTGDTDWGAYKPDLVRHADYKKFGDGLRFVAVGRVQQRMELTHFLESQFNNGTLAYGVQPSFAAMITCYVRDYQREHLHFVDGTDGGYAKASQELKIRRAQLLKQGTDA